MDLTEKKLPCVLCGEPLALRNSKKGKPYFVCEPCGVQFFIRRRRGIERLEALLRNTEHLRIPPEKTAHTLGKIQALLDEIQGLRSKIETSESFLRFLFEDEDSRKARKLLKIRLENAFAKLRQIAEDNSPKSN